jgi:aminoglycoside phosphotransferase (APT) family kinase protein
MHDDEITVSASTVALLVAEQFPSLAGLPVDRVGAAGTVNAIFRVGDEHAARFPLQASGAATLDRELASATAFADVSPVPAPRPLGVGAPGHGYPLPWSVQTWIDGVVADPTARASDDRFADELAGLVGALRSAPTGGRVFDPSRNAELRGGDLRAHDPWMAECLSRSAGLFDVDGVRARWSVLRELPSGGPDVMSHGDLIPGNLLVRDGVGSDGPTLVGVLDTGGFGPADPALDCIVAWHLLDAPRRERFRARLRDGDGDGPPVDYDVVWRRSGAWALEQSVGLVWYYERSNPTMAALGRSTIARLLSADLI